MSKQEAAWNTLYKLNKQPWKKETLNLVPLMKDKIVLELGVGNGKTLTSILLQEPKKVYAIDSSSEAIKISKKIFKNRAIIKKANVLSLPFKEDSFDIIVCYFIFNNLSGSERKKAVKEILRVLRPGGKIIFSDFSVGDYRQKGKSQNQISKSGIKKHFFRKKEIINLFSRFKVNNLGVRRFSPIKNEKSLERVIFQGIFTQLSR